jgi:glycosyltransferase involved in cell wall biosynthesis
MRLGIDVSAVPERPAGAGRYIVELARRVGAVVASERLVTRRGDESRWRELAPSAEVLGAIPGPRPARLAFEALWLGRSAALSGLDVFHSPHYTMPRSTRCPVVVTIHDMTYFTNPEWHERTKVAYFRRSILRAAREAAAIVAVSELTARQLREVASARVPIVVAPHGVDLERFSPGESAERGRYVFFVGTLEPRKGLDVLLAAFGDIADRDSDVELWIAGQRGWHVGELADEIDAHRHGSRIRRLGYVSDERLVSLLRGAQAVVYPSRGEGFGMPVLEALAVGAAVVTSADTVMSEVGGDAVVTSPIGDDAALAAAVNGALELTGEQRAEIARRSRARATLYSWDVSIERHMEAYRTAVQSGR